MSQQPLGRGAIDLSALKQPARPAAPPAGGGPTGAPGAGGAPTGTPGGLGPYAVQLDRDSFQPVLESSMHAPVLLVFYSATRMPASADLARDLVTVSGEWEGRFLAGLVDIDAAPEIAQAMQIPSVPLVVAVVDGRPMPLLQDALPLDELRTALHQVMQQLTAQGIVGRHEPRSAAPVGAGEDDVPARDPRYAPAQDALEAGDVDGAVAEYEKLVKANPADHEAAAGLAMARLLQRTQGVDLNAARAAAAAAPDDVDAQVLVADLDLLGGHVDDAFGRLVELVRRTADDERERVRTHLVDLFAAVGSADPRVATARRMLASALF